MSLQLARELQEEFVHKDQSIREHNERDAEIARIHAEEDLRQMINELDRSNNKSLFPLEKQYKLFVPMDSTKESESHQEFRTYCRKTSKKVKTSDVITQEQKKSDNQDESIIFINGTVARKWKRLP
ncbi:hypothetical protein Tco_1548113 [Tanacetum coccineum]